MARFFINVTNDGTTRVQQWEGTESIGGTYKGEGMSAEIRKLRDHSILLCDSLFGTGYHRVEFYADQPLHFRVIPVMTTADIVATACEGKNPLFVAFERAEAAAAQR